MYRGITVTRPATPPTLLSALLVAVLAGGCAKAKVAAVPEGPALQMPEPPPRVLAPVDEPLPSSASVPDTPAPNAPRQPARPPAARRPAGAPAEAEARPEPPAPTQVATPAPPADPPRELRSAPSAAEALAERNVRDTLGRSARDLGRIDYGRLSPDGRAQYEQAKRFAQQAEQALRDRNLVFAATLADKAASLAAELGPR